MRFKELLFSSKMGRGEEKCNRTWPFFCRLINKGEMMRMTQRLVLTEVSWIRFRVD